MAKSVSDPFRLDGHHALVTGGTHGVGAAIAKAIARAGSDLTLIGLTADAVAQDTISICQSFGVQCELITADLSNHPSSYLEGMLAKHANRFASVDLLVNNVGTFIDVPFLEMDFKRYEITMNLNLACGYFLTQAFAKRWVAEGVSGRVLFTGSINGLLAEDCHTAYDASKGAVASLVRSFCVSLAPHRIRVNSIAPGLVRTPLTSSAIDNPRFNDWMRLHTPNGQVPEPDVCGGAAVFLLSGAAEHIHGQTLYIDGGMSAWQQPDLPKSWIAG
jgi:NAD(P)-dependent dehydrogenase (short-subunit alcohol dehydrogenase family)